MDMYNYIFPTPKEYRIIDTVLHFFFPLDIFFSNILY